VGYYPCIEKRITQIRLANRFMEDSYILVIGGAGYIGSHMVRELHRAGYKAIVLDNFSKGHRDLVVDTKIVEGDLGDANILTNIFENYNISSVMHFAAFSLVGESVESPLVYYRNNVSKTASLLDSMIRYNIKNIIFSSTAAVYGEPESVPIGERHLRSPTNPYGSTKAAVEDMLLHCRKAYGLKYTSLRYFNAAGADKSGEIGERHEPESHLIPLVLKVATGERDSIQIYGTDYPTRDGTCIRDYIHVTDLAQAHLLALKDLLNGNEGSIYNLGNSIGYSVSEVVQMAREITGHSIPVIKTERRPGDPAILIADSAKIRQELGWKPEYENLRDIIATAWKWHQKEARLLQ